MVCRCLASSCNTKDRVLNLTTNLITQRYKTSGNVITTRRLRVATVNCVFVASSGIPSVAASPICFRTASNLSKFQNPATGITNRNTTKTAVEIRKASQLSLPLSVQSFRVSVPRTSSMIASLNAAIFFSVTAKLSMLFVDFSSSAFITLVIFPSLSMSLFVVFSKFSLCFSVSFRILISSFCILKMWSFINFNCSEA